ncbi:molybdate ABC transporter substrate-binding protein [Actinobacillus succinogenes]|uniref:Molybdenum ABC transporter, periplasmic molybdate-binding protein n=1 Tax=Actinobacillus succinogenes (strain ATCC 55618 / DSM 22257 / CCUG 43843 / 130Z) TaxID=339671 RepID=A6VPL6_ACTSZ|nr:molybdate ABC transporter substrate-binding protein [Actinobacillus succinogenes]ABR74913.1 molybdenum ABC transporter, periplasmic molybdate-binding protein [Actinobacillus succinogenes 130Z]PHI40676.1 molybdate ABC transporter substrate-binding protein [Actinobacillus succinogenes]
MQSKLKGKLKNLTLLIGCSLFVMSAEAKVTVFAAASMTNALQEVADGYKKANPQEEIVFSFASSSVLARQINEGAPADIFVSADQKWMDFLVQKQAIEPQTRTNLVANRLVMIAPADSKLTTVNLTDKQWQQALKDSYLAVGDPDHVPAGLYAKAAFTYLNQWDDVNKKLARADNVRKALLLVEKGESPLGVVYATDAAASQKVKIVATFPAQSHPPVEYPTAMVKGHDNAESRAFFQYMTSPESKAVWEKYGFKAE